MVSDRELIYLDGNSLGRMPRRTPDLTRGVVEKEWADRLVRGWGDSWVDLPQRLAAKIARIVGAEPHEVLVCDSTSVNLYKLADAALDSGSNFDITSNEHNFPSDLYVLQGVAERHGGRLDLSGKLGPSTGLLSISHVSFKSGELQDMAAVTAAAHTQGVMTLWDLSHSAGALPIALSENRVDLAVGCTYKYLNGGPGAPAFLYVRKDLQEKLKNPIQGWFGQQNPFAFGLEYEPATGINRFAAGTPPILSMAAIEPGLDLVLDAGLENLRAKSLKQTSFLFELWESMLEPLGVTVNSPRSDERRGSHVSFGHPHALAIDIALIRDHQVIPDFRTPDNLRFASTPLYTTFEELFEGVSRMESVIRSGIYTQYSKEQLRVT